MKFDSPYNPKEVEDKIYKLWEKSGFFNPDKLPQTKKPHKKPYTIVVPPPNITGSLHMGHALNAVIQDILIRQKRMQGYKTLWLPGTDHAGIATQNVVEKELGKQGISRHNLGREKFLEKIWEWKKKYGQIILDQFKKIGASMDWSRTRFTMDPDYQEAVEEAFLHYYKKGWIYRAERVINWCSRCATSLSDLELEYKEEETILYYIDYCLADEKDVITVATTRPETMLGDSAVAVNPKDNRYKNLIAKFVILPIQNRRIPIIGDVSIDPQFGTGAVKVTPGHDLLDAEIGERHKLPIHKIINQRGKMTIEAGDDFFELTVKECRDKVIEMLRKQELIRKEEKYKHNIAVCYRCGTVIEPIPSMQWFLKMGPLAKLAINAVKSGKIKFHPKRWGKVYFDWFNNAKDWCISRQIWWGHQLPIWFCKNQTGISSAEQFVVSAAKPKQCPFCKTCSMVQSADVLDTWFSSALWPFATLGWPQKTKDLKIFYPTSVLSTARDIINLWVARMIFSSLEFANQIPFSDVIIHGTILTKEGRRMSKSLGTGIDPMELIEKYGADATRFGLIWQTMGNQDIHWSEEHVIAGKKFCNKIWNASRFVLMTQNGISNSSDKVESPRQSRDKFLISKQILNPRTQTEADKKILLGLKKLQKEVGKFIEKYEFGKTLHRLYDFFWHQYADIYIETAKKQLTDKKLKVQTQNVLLDVHLNLLKLLHPFLPFITEEIWSRFFVNKKSRIRDLRSKSGQKSKNLLMVENWPK